MKNKIILFIVTFIVGISSVSAYTTTGDKCINDRSCMVVCNYTNVGKSSQNASSSYYSSKYNTYVSNEYITIYYDYKSNNFAVGLWSGVSNVAGKSAFLKGPNSFDYVFSDRGTNIFVQPSMNLNENTFQCPTHGYWDFDDWFGGNEACFDSDGKWCATEKKNAGTRFGDAAGSFLSESRDMTFEDEIRYYFSNWSIGDIDLDDIKNGKYKNAEDIFEKIFLNDFKKNYLNGNNMPQFVKNSSAYQEGVSLARKQFDALKESWVSELDEQKNSGTISDEEYNEIINNLKNIDDNFEEVGKDYSDNIDVIDKRREPLNVDPVDICKVNSTSLKVFQIIGYILLIIKIIVPLILIVLGSIDFGKAALSGDEKSTKEAAVQFAKRVLIGLIVFFIPTVLDFFLSLINGVSETAAEFSNCTSCLFSPTNESKCSPGSLTVDETNDNSDNDGTTDDTNNDDKSNS